MIVTQKGDVNNIHLTQRIYASPCLNVYAMPEHILFRSLSDHYPEELAKFKIDLTEDVLRIHATDELWPLLRDKVFNDLQPQRLEVSFVEIWKAGRLWSRGSIELWMP